MPSARHRPAAVVATVLLGVGVVGLGSAAAAPRRHLHPGLTSVAGGSTTAYAGSPDLTRGVEAPAAPAAAGAAVAGDGLDARTGDGVLLAHDAAGRARLAAAAAADRAVRASRSKARAALPRFARPGTGVLTSCFCWRWGAFHDGIDLAAPLGAPIVAAAAGVVTKAGPDRGYGNVIVIQHAGNTVTFYGHEEEILVKVGQHVTAGQRIALVGNLGYSTGPHLHFGVRTGGVGVDPVSWLRRHGVKV